MVRAREEESAIKRVSEKRREVAERKAKGAEPVKITHAQRAANRNDKRARERKINEILSRESYSQRGRKSEPAYDKADYRAKLAALRGERISVPTLADEALKGDKSDKEYKREKMKQALKRRKHR